MGTFHPSPRLSPRGKGSNAVPTSWTAYLFIAALLQFCCSSITATSRRTRRPHRQEPLARCSSGGLDGALSATACHAWPAGRLMFNGLGAAWTVTGGVEAVVRAPPAALCRALAVLLVMSTGQANAQAQSRRCSAGWFRSAPRSWSTNTARRWPTHPGVLHAAFNLGVDPRRHRHHSHRGRGRAYTRRLHSRLRRRGPRRLSKSASHCAPPRHRTWMITSSDDPHPPCRGPAPVSARSSSPWPRHGRCISFSTPLTHGRFGQGQMLATDATSSQKFSPIWDYLAALPMTTAPWTVFRADQCTDAAPIEDTREHRAMWPLRLARGNGGHTHRPHEEGDSLACRDAGADIARGGGDIDGAAWPRRAGTPSRNLSWPRI